MPDALPRSYISGSNALGPIRVQLISQKPDSLGRYLYTLLWLADYHPGHPDGEHAIRERGQVFFDVPPAPLSDPKEGNDNG